MIKKIKVMIIDDSASVRQVVSEIVDSNPDMQTIAVASDPLIAENMLKKEWPDVFILDIEMPHKDGLTFLKEIMQKHPTPVIICSSLAENNTSVSMEALAAGAVEVIAKPKVGVRDFLYQSVMQISDAVRSAANANLKKMLPRQPSLKIEPKLNADVILSAGHRKAHTEISDRIVAIGASAGGTQATEAILKVLPENIPPIVIVQHMPEKFTYAYAQRLNSLCRITVKEAQNGDKVMSGHAYIAPGNIHLLVNTSGNHYILETKEGPPVSRHRPSVDVMFRSMAKTSGKNALGIILTGMGDDGAAGMLEMKEAGIRTIAQNKETCMVFGMPKEAIERGGVDAILPLEKIPQAIIDFYKLN